MSTVKRIDLAAVKFKAPTRVWSDNSIAARVDYESSERLRFEYIPELHVVQVTTDDKKRPMFWVPREDFARLFPAPEKAEPKPQRTREQTAA